MAYRIGIGVVIKAMLGKMLKSTVSLILYIDLKFLDNNLVKLGTI